MSLGTFNHFFVFCPNFLSGLSTNFNNEVFSSLNDYLPEMHTIKC